MTRKLKRFRLLGGVCLPLLSLLLLCQCAPVYIPNAVNVPLLGEQGDANISASMGTSTLDFQAAYALSGNLGLMANGSFSPGGADANDEHTFIEGGLGFFRKMGNAGRFECYGGYGWGQAKTDTGSDTAEGKYHRFFLQPSIGAATEFFDGAFSLRLAYLNFYDVVSFGGRDTLFVEPVLTTKVGFRFFKLVAQFGLSFPFRQEDLFEDAYEPFIFNLGLQLNLRHKRQ